MSKSHRSKTKSALTLLLALSVGASACTSGDGKEQEQENLSSEDIQLTSALETFDSCELLLEDIKAEALERVGPYGFGEGGGDYSIIERFRNSFGGDEDFAVEESMDMATADAEAPAAAAPQSKTASATEGSFSTTNNQEAAVDEADLVKTDGKSIILLRNQELHIIDAQDNELVTTVKLPKNISQGELFLTDDTIYVMGRSWEDVDYEENIIMEDGPIDGDIAVDWAGPAQSPSTVLIALDRDTGDIQQQRKMSGNYLSAREVDGTIRVVLSTQGTSIDFVYPNSDSGKAKKAAETANRTLIEESTLEDWVPYTKGSDVEVDCGNIHMPKDFAGFGLVTVVTIDGNKGLAPVDSLAVFTDAQDVYASTERLVVATPRWQKDGRNNDDYETALHSFDISDPETISYKASGSVRGSLLNRFSLSEHEGYLRVATTDGSPWGRGNQSESYVTVLEEDDGALKKVGQVGDLGKGETIFAVRFMGDVGYVVTFRQTDPLYTVDLSDPSDPTVRGELKIPGFSEYLHPLSEDMLLGVGTDGDENGANNQAVVSLFDVSDLDDPKRIDTFELAESTSEGRSFSSYSQVANDARAFTLHEDIAYVPVGWNNYSQRLDQERNGEELVAIDVSGETLKEQGRISHAETKECEGFEDYPVEPQNDDAEERFSEEGFFEEREEALATEAKSVIEERFCYSYQPQIERSIVIDDNIYSISQDGVQVNDVDSYDKVEMISFK